MDLKDCSIYLFAFFLIFGYLSPEKVGSSLLKKVWVIEDMLFAVGKVFHTFWYMWSNSTNIFLEVHFSK